MRWMPILSWAAVAALCLVGFTASDADRDAKRETEPTRIDVPDEGQPASTSDEPAKIELAHYLDGQLQRLDAVADDEHPVSSLSGFNAREARELSSHLSAEAQAALRTSLRAYRTKADVLINNIANAETVGFKSRSVVMEDVDYHHLVVPGAEDSDGNLAANGQSVGHGCRVAAVRINFTQGPLMTTDQRFDVAITGKGFFQITDADARGGVLYTRAGSFSVNANGDLVIGSARSGRLIEPAINIPQGTVDVTISNDGRVTLTAGDGTTSQAGPIQLASFINPEGLLPLGENLFAETDASGTSTVADPGTLGFGQIQQGCLEQSNVEPVRVICELTDTLRMLRLLSRLPVGPRGE
ncbi:MAG: flagellar hook-basal body complex protein [Planctomycetes bacterium]|nr:flagellar hook-basal body complex protein [Planctomycetota bacterium]